MADDTRKLLNYIVDHYVAQDARKSVDLDATSRESPATIEADKRQLVRREADRASDLADAFAQGLTLAYQRHRVGGNEIRLDDRKPDENAMADALIQFLVSYDLAASHTQVTEPGHYSYYVTVNWDRLARVARDAGVDLDRALGRSG